jgi:hypothetical protein
MSNLFQRVVSKAVLNGWLPEVIEAPDGKRVYIFYGTLTDLIFNRSFAKAFFPKLIVCVNCGKDLFPYEESCCEIIHYQTLFQGGCFSLNLLNL